MSSFYLNEGWYSSEQLAEVLEANKILNNHLAKAIGELPEGYTLTTHKLNPESLEGAAGAVVAMTQDEGVKITFTQHPEILAVDEDADINPNSLETIEIDLPEPYEYWNAVEGWVKIEEVRQHFDTSGCGTIYKTAGEDRVPLYTAPPKKEWVGLTDEEARELCVANVPYVIDMVRALEAKLKEKNA